MRLDLRDFSVPVPGVLAVGVVIAAAGGQLHLSGVQWGLTTPVFTAPVFTWRAMVSLALPLFVVTMASQNLPGVATIRAAGYDTPLSKIITLTGLATLVLAPFGAVPRELVVAIAGLALLGSIGGGLAVALKDDAHREAALITFLVTLSGVTLAGIGSAFWGVVAGAAALFVQQWRPRERAGPAP